MSTNFVQCACCDYFSIPEGDYEICPVCFWEQDWFGIGEMDEESGANHGLTLRDGRTNFVALGACQLRFKCNVVPEEDRSKFRRVIRNL